MRYLLDTHVVLWWLTEQNKLSVKARKAIANKENDALVSSVVFWEMAIKKTLGRLTLPRNIIEVLTSQGFEMLPLLPEESLGVADLPLIHQDPFDRILVMQAKINDLVLITRDKQLSKYPVDILKA